MRPDQFSFAPWEKSLSKHQLPTPDSSIPAGTTDHREDRAGPASINRSRSTTRSSSFNIKINFI